MPRRMLYVAPILSLVLFAAACGAPDDDVVEPDAVEEEPAEEPTGGDPDEPAEADGEAFRIGYVTDLSGVFRDLFGPTIEGFELYMQQLNDAGGIDGHPVETVVRDDEASPDRAVSLAVELATREDVSAIFGLSGTPTHQPVYDAMEREGVPVVTGFSGIDAPLPPAQAFAYSAGLVAPVIGNVGGEFATQIAPEPRLVCVTFETPGGIAGCEHSEMFAEGEGFEVDRVVFPVEAVDYAPIAQDVLRRDPAIVIAQFGSAQHARLIVALRQAGYEGPYVATPWGTSEMSIIEAARGGVGDTYFYTRYAVIDEDVPGWEDLRAASEQFGTDFDLQNTHAQGWVLGRIAHETLAQCGFPCSPADFDATLQGLDVDVQGLTGGSVQFTEGDHYGPTWWRLYQLDPDTDSFDPVGDWVMRASEE